MANVLSSNTPDFNRYTFQRNEDNSRFATTNGDPLRLDGSNAIPVVLENNDGNGWDGFGVAEGLWTILMIAAAALIMLYVVFTRSNPFVGLVDVWALCGIILKHQEVNVEASPQIITTAWIGLGLIAWGRLFVPVWNKKLRQAGYSTVAL